ncbi:cAMP-regulated phosphoprotein 19-related protein [Actinidia rufa]|uniref:cAMP-regulated phosphoprotein 19-related protein n=1 Tax=Actinidia rufa TaxID=165716 RepID=A0A7J0EME8_9ERIC|nr:cAMP-regulated phosphoprotein 19-related protein [Actinidia rufa]
MSGMEDVKEHDSVGADVLNESAYALPSAEQEVVLEKAIEKKYGRIVPKKPPLISKDLERAFFGSADWALKKHSIMWMKTARSSPKDHFRNFDLNCSMEAIMRGILSLQPAREDEDGPRTSWLPWRQGFDGWSLPWPMIGTKLWIWINASMDSRVDMREFHVEVRGILNSLADSWKAQLDALKDSLQAEIAAIKEEIKEVKGDWSLCKMAVGETMREFPSHPLQGKTGSTRVGGMAIKPKLSCFLCDGNHFARDCPKRAKLSALIRDDEEEPHQEEAKVGSLRLLDAIKAQVGKSKAPRKGRMYVEAKVRGFTTRALIDTGASHNFMEVKEAKRLGLQFKEEEGWVKAVNTEARPIYGVARGVRLHIGEWCGQVDFTVVPMDDYPIVLGMEFLDGVRAFPIPFAETMCIMGEGSACMVPLAREASKSKTLSAMQLYKEDHSVGLETNAKILATILTKSGGASESAQGRHADMAKAAKRRKKRSGKNRQPTQQPTQYRKSAYPPSDDEGGNASPGDAATNE